MTPIQLEVLKQFRRLRIRYLVVGGQAMRAHGIDRRTSDLDLWVARDRKNAHALTRFMRRVQNLPPIERLLQPNFKFTVGDPARPEVDILTSVAGDPSFNDAITRCERLMLGTRRVPVIGVTDLVDIKTASASQMELETADPALVEADRAQAAGTAAKERNDIALLQVLIGDPSQAKQ
ncbi:MAG: hypothetical protein RPV21_18060 [Candidatus Sedimenticola sp. (ex Thyasira tokunagai)]